MNVEELARWIGQHSGEVTPLVGAGLTVPAGAPAPDTLARSIAARVGLDADVDGLTLASVTRHAIEAVGEEAMRNALVDVITGLRLRPTPALTAVCGVRIQRVLTTNYDDGLERSAVSRGLRPVPLLGTDPRGLNAPGEHELHVVHLHGLPGDPSSLVLPGRSTNVLERDGAFRTFTTAQMAATSVVCFGFSLATAEVHLHSILRWLSQEVPGGAGHFLLLPADEADARTSDMEAFAAYGNLTVVEYERDATHSAVERVALAFAPRAGTQEGSGRVTWVEPPLLRRPEVDTGRRPGERMEAIERGWGEADELTRPAELLERGARLLVAGPGMGKTTLIERLRDVTPNRPIGFGRLRAFAPTAAPEEAVLRLLERKNGEPLEVEALENHDIVLLLDGLDEVSEQHAEEAVQTLATAATRWPHAAFVVTSRPGKRAAALADRGFVVFDLPASSSWARAYMETRSVPERRIARAMLDGYGLGALLRIPLFAARLADRLLDVDDVTRITPLRVIVDEQHAAAAREARRHFVSADDLISWLRALAVGLELSGRVSAPVDELAGVQAPGDVNAMRAALVQASLLADVPGAAELPAKTLQEGLCAEVLLAAKAPTELVHRVAAAELDGEWVPRDDLAVTLDLVFEDAEPADRAGLRQLDEQRWARTAVGTSDVAEARAALGAIVAFHADHGLRLWWGMDGGLRSPREAVIEIVRRWPQLVEERRAEFEEDLQAEDASRRSRALILLCRGIAGDAEPWVLSALDDQDSMLVIEAAGEAGRLRLTAARERLLDLLDARDERTRAAALRALVEIVPVTDLPAIAARVRADGLRHVTTRLLERCDLDTGLLVARAGQGSGAIGAWMLDRLIESAHPDAWSPGRVHAVMQLLGELSGLGEPDLTLSATALTHHPEVALAEVRLREQDGRPRGDRLQLLAIRALELDDLRDEPLASAVLRALEEDAEIRARRDPQDGFRRRLTEALDAHGLDVDPQALEPPPRRVDLEPRHLQLLIDVVERWWPTGPLDAQDDDGWLPPKTTAALRVGASLQTPLEPARWAALLDAHLRGRHLPGEFGDDDITGWLADTYEAGQRSAVLAHVTAALNGRVLSRLVAIGGNDHEVADAAARRLRELGPESSMWANAAGLLTERHGAAVVRPLLDDSLTDLQRGLVIGAMARAGDTAAQEEVLAGLAGVILRGGRPEVPHWFDRVSVGAEAAARLAEIALEHDVPPVSAFAIALITRRDDLPALRILQALADRHQGNRGLGLETRQLARRVAGARVRERLPDDLGELVSQVGRMDPGTALPTGGAAST